MKALFLSVVIFVGVSNVLHAQSVWQVTDPNGTPVSITPDSAFATVLLGHVAVYAIDNAGNRNMLFTNGDDSYWLFNEGKPITSSFSAIEYYTPSEFLFMLDNVWYRSDGTPAGTFIYHDNNDAANEYIYLDIFSLFSNIGVSAVERSTGNRVTIQRRTDNLSELVYKDLSGNDIRIYEVFTVDQGVYFAGSTFSNQTDTFTEPGFYAMKVPQDPILQFPMGERQEYEIHPVEWNDSYLVDKLDNGYSDIYKYNFSSLGYDNVTSTVFDGELVQNATNIKIAWNDISLQSSLWKTNPQGEQTRYTLRKGWVIGLPEWELQDVRGSSGIDLILTSMDLSDSVYYYNYDDPGNTLVRANYINGQTKKQTSSIPIDTDYRLRGFDGVMYYAQYDPITDKLVAYGQDILNGYDPFCLESSSGQQIPNPVDFIKLGKYLLVQSKSSNESHTFYVYDSTKTVSTDDLTHSKRSQIEVYPNPAVCEVSVTIPSEMRQSNTNKMKLTIYDQTGMRLWSQTMEQEGAKIKVDSYPVGVYQVCLESKGVTLDCVSLAVQ